MAEETWVSVAQATQITGYNHDHVRRLARENWRLPEEQRRIRVRLEGQAYAIWLPDLVSYLGEDEYVENPEEQIWVNTAEGEKYTGYSRAYLSLLAGQMWAKPESEREVKIKKRLGNHYELWLPDLLRRHRKGKRGPQKKRKLPT